MIRLGLHFFHCTIFLRTTFDVFVRPPVETAVNQTCAGGRPVVPGSGMGAAGAGRPLPPGPGVGYLSSHVARTRRVGSPACPWLLPVEAGRQIVLTLLYFADPPSSSPGGSGDVPVCRVQALVRERGRSVAKRVCDMTSRNRTVYVSSPGRNVTVEIVVGGETMRHHARRTAHFLIRYEGT